MAEKPCEKTLIEEKTDEIKKQLLLNVLTTRLNVEKFNLYYCQLIESKFGCIAIHVRDNIWAIINVFDCGLNSTINNIFHNGMPNPNCLPFTHSAREMKHIYNDEYSFIYSSNKEITAKDKNLLDSNLYRFYLENKVKMANTRHETFVNLLNNSIRNSLNVIMNNVNNQTPPPIKSACIKLTNEIFDLIDYSSLESGMIKFKPSIINLKEFLEKMVGNLPRKITFHTDILPQYVIIDVPRLRQILIHMLNNAIQYSEEDKEILFYVNAQFDYDDLVNLEFIVKDSGIGIHEAVANSIFYPIELKKTTSISLRMCWLMAKAMGGSLCLSDTSRGQGTSFSLRIAVRQEHVDNVNTLRKYKNKQIMIVGDQLSAGLQEIIKKYNFLHIKHERYQNASKYRPDLVVWADSHPAPSNSLVIPKNADFEICRTKMLEYMATHNSERKTLSVLLIDTNLEVVSIIKNMLSELGIKCTVANNRNYKDFISREYDAIILGAKMPIVSGKSLASYIKTINQNSRIIGIYDFDDDSEYFDDFLYPPISIEELRGILI